jgi:hypothetical protein
MLDRSVGLGFPNANSCASGLGAEGGVLTCSATVVGFSACGPSFGGPVVSQDLLVPLDVPIQLALLLDVSAGGAGINESGNANYLNSLDLPVGRDVFNLVDGSTPTAQILGSSTTSSPLPAVRFPNHRLGRCRVDINLLDIAVVDFLVIIILDLHDLIARRNGPTETLDLAIARGVQHRLQFDVQRTRANAAAVHRAEHLDVADRVQAEAFGDAGLHQFQDALNGGLGLVGRNEVEVALASRRAEIGHRALIDAMGIDDDPARGGLPEHLRQPHDGRSA